MLIAIGSKVRDDTIVPYRAADVGCIMVSTPCRSIYEQPMRISEMPSNRRLGRPGGLSGKFRAIEHANSNIRQIIPGEEHVHETRYRSHDDPSGGEILAVVLFGAGLTLAFSTLLGFADPDWIHDFGSTYLLR